MTDIPFEETQRHILEHAAPLGSEPVSVDEANERVIEEEIAAPFDMPGADNSAMDGFAVRSRGCRGPVSLKIAGYRPAGYYGETPLPPNAAVRIMTAPPSPRDTTRSFRSKTQGRMTSSPGSVDQ